MRFISLLLSVGLVSASSIVGTEYVDGDVHVVGASTITVATVTYDPTYDCCFLVVVESPADML